MGERVVPDRYVDIFQGRAPRSVIAKHYTGRGLERLKRIYDRAGLRIDIKEELSQFDDQEQDEEVITV